MPRGGERTYRNCINCGKSFYNGHLKAKLCSLSCAYEARTGTPSKCKGIKRPHLVKVRLRICAVCKKSFRPFGEMDGSVGAKNKRIQKYCGKECWSIRNPPVVKQCPICREHFKTHHGDKHCSQKCRDKFYALFGKVETRMGRGKVMEIIEPIPREFIVVSELIRKIQKEVVRNGYSYNHG